MSDTSSILEMARGAIIEQFDVEVGKVINNILDPNTEPAKKRSITHLRLTLHRLRTVKTLPCRQLRRASFCRTML